MIVNAESHFWTIKEFLPSMIERNCGQIVSVASIAGLSGSPYLADYSASKFAAIGLMEGLRMELKRNKQNITCTIICPFFINTGMFEGVATKPLFPLLDQQTTINRMVYGILQNEEEVFIPWRMAVIIHLSKCLFPAPLNDFFVNIVVGTDAMAQFKGR
jgi:all-trans-retinol dehydrogenase (NAD+)